MRHPVSVSEWRAGWPTLVASMVGYGCSFGLFVLGSSSFIDPVRTAFGWSTSQAAILPISSLTMAVLFPFAGRLIDRWGARPFAICGPVGFALCYLALAICPPSIVLYRMIAVLFGLCGAASGPMTFSRGVGSWFHANRGAALGFMFSGLAVGGFVGIPFISYMVHAYGWRIAYAGLALSILIVGLPPVLAFFHERGGAPAAAIQPVAGVALAGAIRDARFWMLLAAFVFIALPVGVISAHLMPILGSRGFSAYQAASLGAMFAAATGISRIGVGFLLDRFRDYIVAGTCFMGAGAGSYWLFHASGAHAYIAANASVALIGLAFGVEGDLAPYFTLKLFGLRAFAAITGCFCTAIAIFSAIGGFIGSTVADRAGMYDPLAPFMAVSLLAAGCLMLGQRTGKRPVAHPAAAESAVPGNDFDPTFWNGIDRFNEQVEQSVEEARWSATGCSNMAAREV